jgi:hypothetical protein
MRGPMKLSVIILLFAVMTPASIAARKNQRPFAWGTLTKNTGCVIFEEGRKTSVRFYGVAETIKTVGKLTVVETQNYAMDQDEILETQENMDALMQRAQKDHIKFVKIPEKYSDDQLDEARALCK